jgi:hypothetical protein
VAYLDYVKARNGPQNGHTMPRLRRPFDPADSARYAKPMPVEFLISALVAAFAVQFDIGGVRAARRT